MIKLYKKYEEVLKYLIFGFLTMVVSIGTYLLFANTFLASKTDLTPGNPKDNSLLLSLNKKGMII